MTETLRDRIVLAVSDAGAHDPNVHVAPVAILWADEQRQWQSVIPHLRDRLRIVGYGAFDPDSHRGPAYWLRCVIAGTVQLDGGDEGRTVVYLPGVSREMVRSLDARSSDLGSLGGLQHRCTWFSHPNGKDWTVRSLLTNAERGLGLDVAQDSATADALVASLIELVAKPMAQLGSTHIDAGFLNDLLNPDPVRRVLDWLNDPSGFRNGCTDATWAAFTGQLKQKFSADASRGEIECARLLGDADGAWAQVWNRYREMPAAWPGIVERLAQAQPPELLPLRPGAWPGIAEQAEAQLRQGLLLIADAPPSEARTKLLALEDQHKARRSYVWADLGMTPLVLALEHLAAVARLTGPAVPTSSVDQLAKWYGDGAWRTDRAAVAALAETTNQDDMAVVGGAMNAVYKPWLQAAAVALQTAIGPAANAGTYLAEPVPAPQPGEVVVFVDGLRLDAAHMLADRLAGSGHEAEIATALAALPTVTSTAKPAVAPLDQSRLTGADKLDLQRLPDGRKADIDVLRGLLEENGLQILKGADTGTPTGTAWTETGDLDKRGHDFGVALVHELDDEIRRIADRVIKLLEAGWKTVTVVTDHGWLLLYGGLDKNNLVKQATVETRKGRCVRLKPGADPTTPTVPWHWDHDVRIAVANGITCFTENQTYEHGGVSPQECVVPRVTVRAPQTVAPAVGAVVSSMKWKGITLSVEFSELPDRATVDLRTVAGDPATSVIDPDQFTAGSRKRVLFASEDHEGEPAVLVVVGSDGNLLLQIDTTVGQNR